MHAVQKDMEELRKQLKKGSIQKAYRALLSYMMELRTDLARKYGEPAVSGLYQGYMDMTYFALFPPSLKRRDLKIAIVFNYDAFRFEAWLAARNRKIQRQYWELCKDSHWAEYRVVMPAVGIDSIIECDLAKDFDFGDPDALTCRIENDTAAFIVSIEKFLSEPQPAVKKRRGTRCMPKEASALTRGDMHD
ncbi:MAG: hypothetical protein HZB51_29875 [Chloroflexi bacterium]|nr:hypothetical protein [Chloroflexota bacterium]